MKFALNHPERFHRPGMAFFAAFARFFIILMVAVTNAIRIIALCDVLEIVIGYVALVSLIEMDIYAFKSLSNDVPFKTVITATNSERPFMLTIDRTTSMKNNWAHETYTEGKEIDE
jgi:hypothetical protein